MLSTVFGSPHRLRGRLHDGRFAQQRRQMLGLVRKGFVVEPPAVTQLFFGCVRRATPCGFDRRGAG
eukprot:2476607-Lingulodinium_polyedra.AAC.1